MMIPSSFAWRDPESLAEKSSERSRLRVVLFTADSTRILLSLAEHGCRVTTIVTPGYAPSIRAPKGVFKLWQAGRKFFSAPTALESIAGELRIPMLRPWSLQDPRLHAQLQKLKPDVFVTAGYPEIFPASLLRIPALGCINLHASLLPRYRGPQPIAQAILHAEPCTGITLHFMDEGIDTGDILFQDVVPILPDDTVYSLSGKIYELGGRILLDALERLAQGKLRRHKQPPSRSSYFRRLPKEAGRLDWTWPAQALHSLARLSPWLPIHSFVGRSRLSILKTSFEAPVAETADAAQLPPGYRPGQILYRQGNTLAVLCGDGGKLLLLDHKLESWPPRRWFARKKLAAGTTLDPDYRTEPPRPIKNSTPSRTSRNPRSTASA